MPPPDAAAWPRPAASSVFLRAQAALRSPRPASCSSPRLQRPKPAGLTAAGPRGIRAPVRGSAPAPGWRRLRGPNCARRSALGAREAAARRAAARPAGAAFRVRPPTFPRPPRRAGRPEPLPHPTRSPLTPGSPFPARAPAASAILSPGRPAAVLAGSAGCARPAAAAFRSPVLSGCVPASTRRALQPFSRPARFLNRRRSPPPTLAPLPTPSPLPSAPRPLRSGPASAPLPASTREPCRPGLIATAQRSAVSRSRGRKPAGVDRIAATPGRPEPASEISAGPGSQPFTSTSPTAAELPAARRNTHTRNLHGSTRQAMQGMRTMRPHPGQRSNGRRSHSANHSRSSSRRDTETRQPFGPRRTIAATVARLIPSRRATLRIDSPPCTAAATVRAVASE